MYISGSHEVKLNIKRESDVYKLITKIVGNELSNMTKACYYPKLVIYLEDIQNSLGITEDMIKEFRNSLDPKYKVFDIYKDKYTIILMLAILYFARTKKHEISKTFFHFLSIKFYSNIIHKHLKSFCNEDLWIVTLDRLSSKHLFKNKGGIAPAISYIANFDFDKNKNKLSKNKVGNNELTLIIYGLRQKIAQSTRSFAQLYYKLYEEGKTTKQSKDSDISGSQLIADKISMTMCVFGQLDKEALTKSIMESRLRKELVTSIISELSTTEYKDKIKFIIILMSRLIDLKSVCVEKNRNKLMRKINTSIKIGGKYNLKSEILEMLYSLELGYQLKNIYENQLIMFFGSYLTNYMRNRIC